MISPKNYSYCFSFLFKCAVPAFLILISSCSHQSDPLFTQLPASQTGIDFVNTNNDTDTLNILDYLYYYNGAGVALGDINNDGLPDIFFSSNTNGNKLYLNKGNFIFENITDKAGVAGILGWSTGVAMADINGDGLLDIYVCTVANHQEQINTSETHTYFKNAHNELFINNGNGTFTKEAHKWGVDVQGYSTQSVFFDYDKDGDLDMFLLQHSVRQTDTYGDTSLRKRYSAVSGGKLFRNDGNHFTDVTKSSGIISSVLGFGLGVGVADFNNDGWDDIYVSNDFQENDYYYVNQGNGSFKEMNSEAFGHESKFSMGNDVADINNDGWIDIITTDMLPEDEKVLKSSAGDEPLDIFNYKQSLGYYFQYSRNCLQLNTAKGKRFSDIALYSGIAATDWSWCPLIADFNLDGQPDIFISNGIKKRQNDLDNIKFNKELQSSYNPSGSRQFDKEILQKQPPGDWHNYIFEGSTDLKFQDRSKSWGFENPTLSQGAAYADLDGDGDLDIVTNNMNAPAGIYRNNKRESDTSSHYLSISLKDNKKNSFAIGAKVFVFALGHLYYKQMQPVRGFMSSCEPMLNFGLGSVINADSIIVIWPNKHFQKLTHIVCDKSISISYSALTDSLIDEAAYIDLILHDTSSATIFKNITPETKIGFKHNENLSFVDFNRQWFIPHEISTAGPKVTVADVNGDGLEDFFVCGAKMQPGSLYLQLRDGTFVKNLDSTVFAQDSKCEDVDAIFFDADGDKDMDLYVVSGGNEYFGNVPELNDRLYLNDGKGNFAKSTTLPAMLENKSVVCAADFDKDGDMDIFVGGRTDSKAYGEIPTSYLLQNDGKGNFKIVTPQLIPQLQKLGMVTDASWFDVDKDGWPDLFVTGEWMPPVLFKNNHGKFTQEKLTNDDNNLTGWWCATKIIDVNNDGYEDILLGNYGLNSKLTGSKNFPLEMYFADLSGNGNKDQLLAVAKNEKYYPFLGKEDLEKQLPYLKKEYLSYSIMAGKTVEEIFKEKLYKAKLFKASTMASILLLNDGKGHFMKKELPVQMQWAPVFSFAPADYDHDGKIDFLAGGNFYGTTPYEGRYDALPLTLCIGDGKGNFKTQIPVPEVLSNVHGEIRNIQHITIAGKDALIIAVNNSQLIFLQY